MKAAHRATLAARQLMMHPLFNRIVFKLRFFWYVYILKRINTYRDEASVLAPNYSLDMLKKGVTSDRPLRLIRPMSVVDHLGKSAKILSVGCRFETELLYLVGYGWEPGNVRGFDMISYSPWIDCGNMHAMPYADDTWDAVILGWVMTYSDDTALAAREVVRVARDKGIVAIGVSYYPPHLLTDDRLAESERRMRTKRLQTVADYLRLFEPHVERVLFQHDAADPDKEGVCSLVFQIRKPAALQRAPAGA
jgi:SAM-dependent methyltransferase